MTCYSRGQALGYALLTALVFIAVVGTFYVWDSEPPREVPPINSVSHAGPQSKPALTKARYEGEVVVWQGPGGSGCGVFYMHPDELKAANIPQYAAPRGLFIYQGACRVLVP